MVGTQQRQFILLPREGFMVRYGPAFDVLVKLPSVQSTKSPPVMATIEPAGGGTVRIIDTVAENGPKLVELDDKAAEALNRPNSPLRAVPIVNYSRPDPRLRPLGGASVGVAAGLTTVVITCTDAVTE
jgi:hypothetical protein